MKEKMQQAQGNIDKFLEKDEDNQNDSMNEAGLDEAHSDIVLSKNTSQEEDSDYESQNSHEIQKNLE